MLLQLLMSLKLQETFWKQQQTVWTELSAEEQEQIEIKIQEDNRGDQLYKINTLQLPTPNC
jgi:hypothetical protein